ncbi:hypothetical protein [Laceyella putida]|uniref:Uncharacterized protein n=1 Tax=Laceyella putida TaxID=110101 RepID=A0ABW2RRE2_9BACL
MKTLYAETMECLDRNHRTPEDVLWVGTDEWSVTWESFAMMAKLIYVQREYRGGPYVTTKLVIRGKDFVMKREEYDGAERWQFISLVQQPKPSILAVSLFQP